MKVAILPPYFFPTISYFQVLNLVDTFVVFDVDTCVEDERLYKSHILGNKFSTDISMTPDTAQVNYINEINYQNQSETALFILNKVALHYRSAKYFHDVMDILENMLIAPFTKLVEFNTICIAGFFVYLDLTTNLNYSSEITTSGSYQQRISQILQASHSTEFIDLPSNRTKYDMQEFRNQGVNLFFLESQPIQYTQFDNPFVPNLSIIDVMMFNHPRDVKKTLLKKFQLVR